MSDRLLRWSWNLGLVPLAHTWCLETERLQSPVLPAHLVLVFLSGALVAAETTGPGGLWRAPAVWIGGLIVTLSLELVGPGLGPQLAVLSGWAPVLVLAFWLCAGGREPSGDGRTRPAGADRVD